MSDGDEDDFEGLGVQYQAFDSDAGGEEPQKDEGNIEEVGDKKEIKEGGIEVEGGAVGEQEGLKPVENDQPVKEGENQEEEVDETIVEKVDLKKLNFPAPKWAQG